MNRQAIGRASEALKSRYDKFYYDSSTECITTNWSQMKTGHQDIMSFFNDREVFEMDPLQALASYIIRSEKCLQCSQQVLHYLHYYKYHNSVLLDPISFQKGHRGDLELSQEDEIRSGLS